MGRGKFTLVGKLRGEVPLAGDVAIELNREVRLVQLVGVEGNLVVTREYSATALQGANASVSKQ